MQHLDIDHMERIDMPDIREIIDNRQLVAHFQQIVSVSRKTVNGIEGLIRGVEPSSGRIIPPVALFQAAQKAGVTLELDRVCREVILEAFGDVYQSDHKRMLYLNLDASILADAVGSGYLYEQVVRYGINPGNIVIEISEKNVTSSAPLKKFADTYKNYGFMLALDDVGTGFSNMDRILLVKPDIIKIDISLVKGISEDFYKQGVFKSLVTLSNKLGALVIAEGVETEAEAFQTLRLGGHMIQGYYLSRPQELKQYQSVYDNDRIEVLSKRFNEYMRLQFVEERNKNKKHHAIVRRAVKRLTGALPPEYNELLSTIVAECEMECAYVLDEHGIQVSDTISSANEGTLKESLIFYAATKGTDHSMEKYYYPMVSAKLKRHATEPYISLATGSLCMTVSTEFTNAANNKNYFCADFKTLDSAFEMDIGNPLLHMNPGIGADMMGIINKMNREMVADSLTGAYNRRFIEDRLLLDIFNAANKRQPISIVLADIDMFKTVNDQYGHMSGDAVLKQFVRISKTCIRQGGDWIARYGGDEFLIVLANADELVAKRVAEKIRNAVEKSTVICEGVPICFTASFGTYTVHSENMSWEELIRQADKNLYQAKNAGRNKTISNLAPSDG